MTSKTSKKNPKAQALFDKIPYLKNIIQFTSSKEDECSCLLCTKNQLPGRKGAKKNIVFARKGLKNHLSSVNHKSFTYAAEDSTDDLEKAIKALSKNIHSKEDESNDFSNSQEDKKMRKRKEMETNIFLLRKQKMLNYISLLLNL